MLASRSRNRTTSAADNRTASNMANNSSNPGMALTLRSKDVPVRAAMGGRHQIIRKIAGPDETPAREAGSSLECRTARPQMRPRRQGNAEALCHPARVKPA
jgi:hypothetical protein